MYKFPARLISFWYPDSLIIFLRIWNNLLNIIEEDLAVGLMLRLLFVPLFHDSTVIGRALSIVFRLVRVVVGFFAYLLATLVLILMALIWFSTPVLLLTGFFLPDYFGFQYILGFLLIFGLGLFVSRLMVGPAKQIWQLNNIDDLWRCSKLKKTDITWEYLTASDEVKALFRNLELDLTTFPKYTIFLNDEILGEVLKIIRSIPDAKLITPGYFFVAALMRAPNIENTLLQFNLKPDDFIEALAFLEHKRSSWRKVFIWDHDFAVKHLKGVNRGWLGAPTPFLDYVSEDLTREASRRVFPDFIGRGAVVSEVISILSQERDRNVLLVGSSGSGRTAMIDYLAKLIVAGDAPEALATKRLVSLDITRLMSGAMSQGDLAGRIKDVFDEVRYIQEVIIFIDEIENMGIGEAGVKFNIFALLLPYLESDDFQFIAVTEPENYAKIIEKHSDFARIFHRVELPQATDQETLQIIKERGVYLARYQKIELTYLAAKRLVELSKKLIHDRVLPDAALFVLQECEPQAVGGVIDSELVKRVLENKIKVPIVELDSSQKLRLLNLEDIIHQRLIDQEDAVKKVSDALRRSATALREGTRPIGSFLFVGPTGVGKTELAKTLAEVYFHSNPTSSRSSPELFIRFDMSEYQTEEAVNRLLGTLETPGELTEAIKVRPYALLLLDEFEKADPKILSLFLQVLDDGRLTDASGKTIDFSNVIIIATSNAASLIIAEGLKAGKTIAGLDEPVKAELLKIYKPELINRFDSVVIFKPLSPTDSQKIVEFKLQALASSMREEGYLIEFKESLIEALTKQGFDPVLGARPLRRLIQDTIESRLSRLILESKLKKGVQYLAGEDLLV